MGAFTRVVSNDQTKCPKTCYFGKKKMAALSKKTTKRFDGKHCTFGKLSEIEKPFSSSCPQILFKPHRAAAGSRRSPWSKCRRRKDSRHSTCTSEVDSPSSPAKFALQKLWRLLFVMILQHPFNTTPMWHSHGTHGQCRQPYHRCCQ